jgi:signal transduction histidine kinase
MAATRTTAVAGSILIIDDRSDPDVLQALTEVLAQSGFAVRAATIRTRRAEYVQHDVVLLLNDSASNLKYCRQVKQHEDSPLVLVILGDAPASDWVGFEAGVDDLLLRPFSEAELLARITLALRSRSQRSHLVRSNRGLEKQVAEHNRELEQMLFRSRELTVMKDNIVSNVSHELRTPLLQVKSAVSMLSDEIPPGSEGPGRLVKYALQATAKLESVVQNISTLASSLNLKQEVFILTDSINIALRQLNRVWESKGGVERIRLHIPAKLPFILGDRGGVAQVLQQLLDNAIKFSPNGEPVEVIAAQTGTLVRITVRDYGIGIAKDQLEKIFQAFYQVDGGSKRGYGGAGVGLSIVKLIMDGLGSQIEVDSELGQGSAFWFTLPAAIDG